MITVDGADSYFSESSFCAQWEAYSALQRIAAIAAAKRSLSRALGRALNENEPPYQPGDTRRDEYAVYEQALYILVRDALPEGTGAMVPALNPDEAETPRKTMSTGNCPWSHEALNWLGEVRAPMIALA